MAASSRLTSIAVAFASGFLAVLVFHQGLVAVLSAAGIAPPNFAAWSLEPIPPWGVPSLVSKAFWGGVWAILLWFVMAGRQGAVYWLGWMLLGAIALPLVAIFVVPLIKGGPPLDFWSRFPLSAMINAAWGLGTALFLRVFAASER